MFYRSMGSAMFEKLNNSIFYLLLLVLFLSSSTMGCECSDSIVKSSNATLKAIPGSVVFSAIPLGQSETQEVALRNVGEEPLTVRSISLENETEGQPFSLEGAESSENLQLIPGQSTRIKLLYKPSVGGIARGKLVVVSNAANTDTQGRFFVEVRSQELASGIKAEPNPVDFDIVPVGKSVKKKIVISNTGTIDLEIESATLEEKAQGEIKVISNPNYPIVVPPKQKIELEVEYTPKSLPLVDVNLILKNNSTSNPNYPVRLVGKQSTPNIEVSPLELTFATEVYGKQTKTLTIKNRGTLPLTVNALGFDQATGPDFTLPSKPKLPLVVEPNQTVTLEVLYHPKDTKEDVGLLEIQSNDPDSPTIKVNLKGKAQGCYMEAAPTSLHFTKPLTQSFSVINQGNKPCIYKVAYFGPNSSTNFGFSSPVPRQQEIGPGQKLTFEVKFEPKGPGKESGEVVVEMDNPNQPEVKVQLTSEIKSTKDCDIVATPQSLDFGLLEVGKSKQLKVEIKNLGFDRCSLQSESLNGSRDFKVTKPFPAGGIVLASEDVYSTTISFTPTGQDTSVGTLIYSSKDKRISNISIKVRGGVIKICITAIPTHMDFGVSKTGCSVGRKGIEIFNLCTNNVDISKVEFSSKTNTVHKEFSIQSLPKLPFVIQAKLSQTVEIAYVPNDLGSDVGTLEIHNSAFKASFLAVTLEGSGVNTDEQTDTFKQLKDPQLDILFVIDNSGSMGNDQTNLATNLKAFFQWATALSLDYHIGVTTTDVGKHKGCVQGTTTKVVKPSTPNLLNVLETNVRVGTSGSGKEQGLEASRLAFGTSALQGCNKPFYRKDASLALIYISDEPDQSPLPIDSYINFLRSIKGVRKFDMLRASAIGLHEPSTCKNGGNCRYYAITKVLRGVYDSIKTTSWNNTLNSIGSVTFGRYGQFFLSRPADPKTIQVKVDSKLVPEGAQGWLYDGTNNSIRFSKGKEPGSRAVIEVSYKALCLKP